jgi:hypothetical protein
MPRAKRTARPPKEKSTTAIALVSLPIPLPPEIMAKMQPDEPKKKEKPMKVPIKQTGIKKKGVKKSDKPKPKIRAKQTAAKRTGTKSNKKAITIQVQI